MVQTGYFGTDLPIAAAALPSVNTELSWHNVQRRRLRKFARRFAVNAPIPVETLRSQGEADVTVPEVVASRDGFTQLRRDLPVIDQYYEYSGEVAYRDKVRRICLAWARTNRPDGKPINETNFEWLLRVMTRRRADFSGSDLATLDAWVAALRAAKETFTFATTAAEGVVRDGNWYSHHYKILLLAYAYQGDGAARDALLAEIDGFAVRNFPYGNAAMTYPLVHDIVGSNSAGRRFDVSGNHLGRFVAGAGFAVTGSSSGNDGSYTVASASYLGGSGKTRIVTAEPVIADGGGGSLTEAFADTIHDMPRAAAAPGESIDHIRRDALHYQVFDLAPWLEIALLTGSRYQSVIEAAWSFFQERLLSPAKHYEFTATTDSFDASRWQASHPEYLAPAAMFKPQRAVGMMLAYHHWRRSVDPGHVETSRDLALCLRATPEISSYWPQYFRWSLGYGANA